MRSSGKNGLWKKVGMGFAGVCFSAYVTGCEIVDYIFNNPDLIGPAIEYHGENPIRRRADTANPNLRPYISVCDDRDGKITNYEIVFPNFDSDGDGCEEPGKGEVLISAEDSSGNSNSRAVDMEVF